MLGDFTQGSAKTAWRNHWAECCNLVEVGEMAARRAAEGGFMREKFGLFHEVSRKSTKVRTDQGRGYAMLRIVTGGSLF